MQNRLKDNAIQDMIGMLRTLRQQIHGADFIVDCRESL